MPRDIFNLVGSAPTSADIKAVVESALPVAADAMPPGVAVAGAKGSSDRFARADHTHATE